MEVSTMTKSLEAVKWNLQPVQNILDNWKIANTMAKKSLSNTLVARKIWCIRDISGVAISKPEGLFTMITKTSDNFHLVWNIMTVSIDITMDTFTEVLLIDIWKKDVKLCCLSLKHNNILARWRWANIKVRASFATRRRICMQLHWWTKDRYGILKNLEGVYKGFFKKNEIEGNFKQNSKAELDM
jgi:hypothetical protein